MLADATGHRPRPDIVPRRPRLDVERRRERYWLGDDVVRTTLWDAFSVLLPCGERFFVRSVRHFRDAVEDPLLRREVDAFITQEATHARAHQAWNVGLTAQGHDVAGLEAPAVRVLDWLTAARSPSTRLAVTCAIEHFTAIIADLLLRDPTLLADAEPRHAELWFWHAVEETEHKAVAFDVMAVVLGARSPLWRYLFRTKIYLETTIVFNAVTLVILRRLLAGHPWQRRLAAWLKIGWYLVGRPGIYRRCFVDYCRYLRPGFHPWQHDNSALLDRWRPTLSDANTAAS